MAIITEVSEIAKLRTSGQIAAAALLAASALVRPGVSTEALNDAAEKVIRERGGRPSFLGYQDYPASLCTSINDEVVHGIPAADRRLKQGDLIGLDVGVDYQGLFTDTAITVPVGTVTEAATDLLTRTKQALQYGLDAVKPGNHIGDISHVIESYLKIFNYGIVRQLTGHGVGHAVHEAPAIPNFGQPGTGPTLTAGMVLAIEPMVTRGGHEVVTAPDGWTVLSKDGSLAAHFEHTIMVTETGMEIMTQGA